MKKLALYVLGLLLCATFLSVMPVEGEEGIYDSVVRLHILANSDGEEDQTLKFAVRDAVLAAYGEELNCTDKATAEERITALLPAIKKTAEDVLATHGSPHTVKICFTEEKYPTRTYGELSFPAGVYSSLRIVIGAGEGQNWWCCLFPPLCLGAATVGEDVAEDACISVGFTPTQYKIITESDKPVYRARFKILELFKK